MLYYMCTIQLMLNEEKHLIFKGKWSDLSKRLHLHPNNWDVKRSSVIFLPIGTKSEAFSRDFLTNVNVAAHRWTHTHTHTYEVMILQYFLLMALVCHSSVQMVHFCWQRNPTNHRNALFLDIPSFTVLRAHFKTSSLLHQMGSWWIEPQYKVAQGVIVAAWRCLKRPHKTMVLFVTMAVIFLI